MRSLPALDPPRPRWWIQVALVVGFAWAYDEVRALHGNVVAIATRHAGQVAHADRVLHMDWSPQLNHWVSHHDSIADVLSGYYVVMHLGMTSLMLLLLYLQGQHYRHHRDVLIFGSLVGLVVYWVYPCAPPRLAGPQIHDTIAHALPFAYRVETHSANLYAAIPSLHMAWAVWVAVAIFAMTRRWWWRTLAVLHPLVTALTVLATGNHYTVDVLSGVALTAISYPLFNGLSVAVRSVAIRSAGIRPVGTRSAGVRSAPVRRKLAGQEPQVGRADRGRLLIGELADGGREHVRGPDHGLADSR